MLKKRNKTKQTVCVAPWRRSPATSSSCLTPWFCWAGRGWRRVNASRQGTGDVADPGLQEGMLRDIPKLLKGTSGGATPALKRSPDCGTPTPQSPGDSRFYFHLFQARGSSACDVRWPAVGSGAGFPRDPHDT